MSEALREKKKIHNENIVLKEEVEKLRSLNKQLLSDDNKYGELNTKTRQLEQRFQRQLDAVRDKYENAFVETVRHCNEAVKIVDQRKKDLTSLYASDVVDAKKPLPSPR